MSRGGRGLLVVDGYNVIHATPRYQALIDEAANGAAAGAISRLGSDPFVRAREALVCDVAAFAGHGLEPVIVFDGAGNLNPDHPELASAGVRLVFSAVGQSADEVIEHLVTEARHGGRAVTLVTSDGTVRAVSGFGPGEVTCMSSALLVQEIEHVDREVERYQAQQGRTHFTLEDRLSPDQRARLNELIGRA